jgi:hypothetical protein
VPWLAIAGVLLGVAAGAGAYQTSGRWLPVAAGWFRSASPVAQASAGLQTFDRDGQLQILWDGAAAVRSGRSGILLIGDGPQARSIPLDADHLRAGSVTYARQSERVDITLTIDQPNGRKLIEGATFLGRPPIPAAAPAPAPPPALAAQAAPAEVSQKSFDVERDALKQQNAHLKATVAVQAERIRQLEKSLETEKRLLELRSRMQNQSTGGSR